MQERLALEHLIAHGCIVQVIDKYQSGNCALYTFTLGIHRNQNKREIFPRIVFHDTEYRSYRHNDLAEKPGKGIRLSIPLYGTH
jgi:hypothetical protein